MLYKHAADYSDDDNRQPAAYFLANTSALSITWLHQFRKDSSINTGAKADWPPSLDSWYFAIELANITGGKVANFSQLGSSPILLYNALCADLTGFRSSIIPWS